MTSPDVQVESAADPAAPVRSPVATDERTEPRTGLALCLSGGGFRAMLFHVGVLWRLNEAGILGRLDLVSSVSGGSITAGVLGLHWPQLEFGRKSPIAAPEKFQRHIVDPLRAFAARTIDVPAVLKGLLFSGGVAKHVARAYDKHLFQQATLQVLPKDDQGPRFVLNSSNVMTGALWRFSRPYMGDWRVGSVYEPQCSLATAVAASSAFPPFLSPLRLELDPVQVKPRAGSDLHLPPYTRHAILSDGGVYDNLGLEPAYKRCRMLLVSDAGQKLSPEPKPRWNWLLHLIRAMNLLDDQVRSQRKRNLMAAYLRSGPAGRLGAYWSIGSTFAGLADGATLDDPLQLGDFDPTPLAQIATRLGRMSSAMQERLINWGYAVCDTALRRYTTAALNEIGVALGTPAGLPYRQTGLTLLTR